MNLIGKYKILMCLSILAFSTYSMAQKKTHVLTKTVKKELKADGRTLIIRGEKSTINISSWAKPYYGIEIKLISKNFKEKKAKKDLEVIKYKIEESNQYYLLNNYFSSDKYYEVSSNLSAVYNIKVPASSKLDIANIYGNINLDNLKSVTNLKNSFGEISVTNTNGKYNVNSYYSDVMMENIDMDLQCNADKSDIELVNVSGSVVIKSNYGKIQIEAASNLESVNIDSQRSTVFFASQNLKDYNYSLSTKQSKITLPDKWQNKLIEKDGYTIFSLKNIPKNPFIQIRTTYCQISIK